MYAKRTAGSKLEKIRLIAHALTGRFEPERRKTAVITVRKMQFRFLFAAGAQSALAWR